MSQVALQLHKESSKHLAKMSPKAKLSLALELSAISFQLAEKLKKKSHAKSKKHPQKNLQNSRKSQK